MLMGIRPLLTVIALVGLLGRGAPEHIVVDTLKSVGGLPAHLAGQFTELTLCHQLADGTFLVFDRRSHTVFSVDPRGDTPREIVQIGAEPGKILRPYAFDVAADDSFVIADAPANRGRVQIFTRSGSRLGGFAIPARSQAIIADGVVISGVASLVYNGRAVLLNQPDSGSLISELGVDGVSARSFGELRSTGYEQDRDLHLALNNGLVVVNPEGGFYFVFVAGVPVFRKYDALGALVFERHIEGTELDDYLRNRPTAWPTRKTADGEVPIVPPIVRAAAADGSGQLWVSLSVPAPVTYVYDRAGDKSRVVQFRAAGQLAPTGLSFTPSGRLLATPGCFLFEPRPAATRK
jgi:hypothetical protein